jgi:AbrB family looped-hinge helix DNA binding protein
MAARVVLAAQIDRLRVRRYLTLAMTTRVSSKGQIVLPAEIRQADDIKAGQQFEVQRVGRGEYRLIRREPGRNEGLVDWLLACPDKGYFVPIESESTDTL